MIPYTLIVASASRPHLLARTLQTLFARVDQLPIRMVVHDDAAFPGKAVQVERALRRSHPAEVPLVWGYDDPPLKHGPALKWLLDRVETEYVLYSQDDHQVIRPLPIRTALAVLDRHRLNQIRFNKRDTLDKKGREGEEFYKVEYVYPIEGREGYITLCAADHWYFQTGLWRVAAIKPVVDWWARPEAPGAFTEHCVVGSTIVDTPRGPVAISDLAAGLRGDRPYVYAYDRRAKRFTVAQAHGFRRTQAQVPVWKLTCEDGTYLIATPDHRLMLRSGAYRRLDRLRPGDSLMPLYRGYTTIRVAAGEEPAEHRFVAGEVYGAAGIAGLDVNHKDGNRANNDPDNLEPLTRSAHVKKLRPEYQTAALAAMHKQNREAWADPVVRARIVLARRRFTQTKKFKDRARQSARRYWRRLKADPVAWAAWRAARSATMKVLWATPERQAIAKARRRGPGGRILPGSFAITVAANNHTVARVEPWGLSDVYNGEVPRHHNFVANGLVVHNCEYKINDCFNGKYGRIFPAVVPYCEPAQWNLPEVRATVHKTFIWGKVGEPAFIGHIGGDPKDWAYERANRDPVKNI